VAHGKTAREAYQKARTRYPKETALVTYVLRKDEELLIV
jgi:hypothetical protein